MLRVSEAEYQALLGKKKNAGKIPHTIIKADGYVFPSGAEYRRYGELKLLQQTGKIRDLRVHTRFKFVVNETPVGSYTDDFDYYEDGEFIVEDVKSSFTVKDPHYRRQKRRMKAHYGITIREIIT